MGIADTLASGIIKTRVGFGHLITPLYNIRNDFNDRRDGIRLRRNKVFSYVNPNLRKIGYQYFEPITSLHALNECYVKSLTVARDYMVQEIGMDPAAWQEIENTILRTSAGKAYRITRQIIDDGTDLGRVLSEQTVNRKTWSVFCAVASQRDFFSGLNSRPVILGYNPATQDGASVDMLRLFYRQANVRGSTDFTATKSIMPRDITRTLLFPGFTRLIGRVPEVLPHRIQEISDPLFELFYDPVDQVQRATISVDQLKINLIRSWREVPAELTKLLYQYNDRPGVQLRILTAAQGCYLTFLEHNVIPQHASDPTGADKARMQSLSEMLKDMPTYDGKGWLSLNLVSNITSIAGQAITTSKRAREACRTWGAAILAGIITENDVGVTEDGISSYKKERKIDETNMNDPSSTTHRVYNTAVTLADLFPRYRNLASTHSTTANQNTASSQRTQTLSQKTRKEKVMNFLKRFIGFTGLGSGMGGAVAFAVAMFSGYGTLAALGSASVGAFWGGIGGAAAGTFHHASKEVEGSKVLNFLRNTFLIGFSLVQPTRDLTPIIAEKTKDAYKSVAQSDVTPEFKKVDSLMTKVEEYTKEKPCPKGLKTELFEEIKDASGKGKIGDAIRALPASLRERLNQAFQSGKLVFQKVQTPAPVTEPVSVEPKREQLFASKVTPRSGTVAENITKYNNSAERAELTKGTGTALQQGA